MDRQLTGKARAVQCEPVRPMVLEVDWGDPFEVARILLTSDWPALALVWQGWPDQREEAIARWCEDATSDPWLWGQVWALCDHAVYCGWDRPWVLRRFVRDSPPAGRVDPRDKKELRVRLAAVVEQLQKQGLPQSAARACCVAALPESDRSLDASTHSKRFFFGPGRVRGTYFLRRFLIPRYGGPEVLIPTRRLRHGTL